MKSIVLFIFSAFLLFSYQSPLFAASVYQYDKVGNLISGDGKYFEYNQTNKLVRVRQGTADGPVIAEYVYDHAGQRIKKIENGVTTYYIGKLYEEEYSGGSQTSKASYYFANNQRVAKKDKTGELFFIHSDHLGGTNAITNATGGLIERTAYYPFGDIREGGAERYSYTGKEKDQATDFYYFEARYYNPGYRHFTQPDVIVPKCYNPQSFNRYTYVINNPVKYLDPNGYEEAENSWFSKKIERAKRWISDKNYELWTGLEAPAWEVKIPTNNEEFLQQQKEHNRTMAVAAEMESIHKDTIINLGVATYNSADALVSMKRGKPLKTTAAITRNLALLSDISGGPSNLTNALNFVAYGLSTANSTNEIKNIIVNTKQMGGIARSGQLTLGTHYFDKNKKYIAIESFKIVFTGDLLIYKWK